VAATRHGLVRREELRGAGWTDRRIRYAVASGRLFEQHPGVYAVGVPVHTDRARWLAAVLATGGVLSHGSAAALLGFARRAPVRPHVVVPLSRGRSRPGIVVHVARRLDPRDVSEVDGIAVTTGPRTLLDRAAQLGRRALERELAAARALGLAPTDRLRDVIARHPGRAGGPALAAALLGPFTRSELERRFLDLLRDAGLPLPRCNVLLLDFEVDCLWEDAGLVVELDGRATHGVTAQLARDAAKDAALLAAGLRVERLTWWDVVRDARRTEDLVQRVSGR
jgi:very-short-patch-repair endonuclease